MTTESCATFWCESNGSLLFFFKHLIRTHNPSTRYALVLSHAAASACENAYKALANETTVSNFALFDAGLLNPIAQKSPWRNRFVYQGRADNMVMKQTIFPGADMDSRCYNGTLFRATRSTPREDRAEKFRWIKHCPCLDCNDGCARCATFCDCAFMQARCRYCECIVDCRFLDDEVFLVVCISSCCKTEEELNKETALPDHLPDIFGVKNGSVVEYDVGSNTPIEYGITEPFDIAVDHRLFGIFLRCQPGCTENADARRFLYDQALERIVEFCRDRNVFRDPEDEESYMRHQAFFGYCNCMQCSHYR